MQVTGGRNARGDFLWYSHRKILDAIDQAEGINTGTVYRSLTVYLSQLVKGGHLIRAVKPHSLSRKVQRTSTPEYLYRQTGKPFKRGLALTDGKALSSSHVKGMQAHELWRVYRRLPKWYRDMMMD